MILLKKLYRSLRDVVYPSEMWQTYMDSLFLFFQCVFLFSSQLRPLDNPLEILSFPDWVPFREWCSKILCDPSSSPLGVVADFLISRFDKGLTVVTLRSYRSAMASCLRGFSDGSLVTNSAFLTRLVRSFFLKRPSFKTLVPAWSLPTVLIVLASVPFEPLHIASLCLLTL